MSAEPTDADYRTGVDVAYAIVVGPEEDGAAIVARALAEQRAAIVARYEELADRLTYEDPDLWSVADRIREAAPK